MSSKFLLKMAAPNHGFSGHLTCIERLCRICGSTLNNSTIYHVKQHLYHLNCIFDLHFGEDLPNVHPTKFCKKCY